MPQATEPAVVRKTEQLGLRHVLDRTRDEWSVWFSEPQEAAAPGQAAVFYRGDEVLGGGTIESALRR